MTDTPLTAADRAAPSTLGFTSAAAVEENLIKRVKTAVSDSLNARGLCTDKTKAAVRLVDEQSNRRQARSHTFTRIVGRRKYTSTLRRLYDHVPFQR